MGFTAIVAATYLLLGRHRTTRQHDIEKADIRLVQRQDAHPNDNIVPGEEGFVQEQRVGEDAEEDAVEDAEDAAEDAEDGVEEHENEEGGQDLSRHPSPTRSRRFRHFATFNSTVSDSTFTRTLTRSTTSAAKHWFARAKSFVFPKYPAPAEIEEYVPTYRYSPMVSGVLIPFSILLEIPGLTEHWYVITENNQEVDSRPNPALLNIGMGISIACAVLANICLIMRFAERWIKPTTLLCIFFLTVHDGITITAVTVFGIVHDTNDGYTYGQAFWMTLCSTIASTITNVSLIVDYVRVHDFSHHGSGLTRKQRSLMVLVIVLLLYLALGAVINSQLLSISYINGLYFSTVCIETIGFGDIVPHTTGGRVFVCGYIVFGMVILGMVISIARDTVLEGLEVGYRKRLRNMRARKREARRFRHWQRRWRDAVAWRLKEQGSPVWMSDKDWRRNQDSVRFVGLPGKTGEAEHQPWMRRFVAFLGLRERPPSDPSMRPTQHVPGHPRGMHLNIMALSHEQLEAAALEAGVPLNQFLEVSPANQIATGGARLVGAGPFPDGGWPSQVNTPTDAQIGRMASVLTKVSLAISGRDIGLPGPSAQDQVNAQTAIVEEHDERIREEQRKQLYADAAQAPNGAASDETHETSHFGGVSRLGFYWGRAAAARAKQVASILLTKAEAAVADEEKNANMVKLVIAWTVFLLFWFVGAAIFSATEGWTYGIALYFCWESFTTAGFGDYTPQTPAGRSIFVVWALFGVGTLTILVAVIEDAGSSRYKDAMHSRAFDKAVAKYRKKAALQSTKVPRAEFNIQRASNAGQMMVEDGSARDPEPDPSALESTAARLEEARAVARRQLEALPIEIVRRARTFHDYMQYFAGGHDINDSDLPGEGPQTNVPDELKKLLDEIVKSEGIGDRVKREILQDEDAKHTLFLLSIERTLRKMIGSAERALEALADRNALMALYEEQQSKTATGTPMNVDSAAGDQLVRQNNVPTESQMSVNASSSQPPPPSSHRGASDDSFSPSLSPSSPSRASSPSPHPSNSVLFSPSPSSTRSSSPPRR